MALIPATYAPHPSTTAKSPEISGQYQGVKTGETAAGQKECRARASGACHLNHESTLFRAVCSPMTGGNCWGLGWVKTIAMDNKGPFIAHAKQMPGRGDVPGFPRPRLSFAMMEWVGGCVGEWVGCVCRNHENVQTFLYITMSIPFVYRSDRRYAAGIEKYACVDWGRGGGVGKKERRRGRGGEGRRGWEPRLSGNEP